MFDLAGFDGDEVPCPVDVLAAIQFDVPDVLALAFLLVAVTAVAVAHEPDSVRIVAGGFLCFFEGVEGSRATPIFLSSTSS